MRDPDQLHKPYEYQNDNLTGIIKIDELPEYRIWDYDLNDDKSFKKVHVLCRKECSRFF